MMKQKLRPYVGIIVVVLYGIDIFWLSDILAAKVGRAGLILHELLLLLIAVGTAVVFRADLRRIFPFRKPELKKILGTILLWIGMFLGTMLITMIVAYIFPEQMLGTGQQLSGAFSQIPFLLSVFMIAIVPAVCEEAAFRGTLLSCFRGFRNKWAVIILVAVIFGAFHGSVWRLIPTAILGGAMGYLLLETDNMLYNMLFHFVNNVVPLVLLAMLKWFPQAGEMEQMAADMEISRLPAGAVGIYMILGSAAPLLVYIANHLLHHGQRGYDKGLFPAGKRHWLIIFLGFAGIMTVAGMMLFLFSAIANYKMLMEGDVPFLLMACLK